ncbi:hypothetical protein [Borrelia crocidurae]|uniref:Uncharacterized protein n=1 Tax=Borrelia crocidurae (strain Achema) TaxID=1155096 RepID=I0FBD0_BORCA|nr:hypothetical protein [Borrelia crocidurae]AFI30786.1 hypothetical protein Q7M_7 [Borrelia crocidurae str. Achema]
MMAASTKKYSLRDEEKVEVIENTLLIGILSLMERKGKAGKRKAEMLLPVIISVLRVMGN